MPAIDATAYANSRTVSSIEIQTLSTHVFAITAYWGLNILVNRSGWGNQHIWVIVIFIFYPWLVACQLAVNIVCIFRNIAFSAVGPDEHNALAYYLSGLLGVHHQHEDRSHAKYWWGNKRILDQRRATFRLERRKWDQPLIFQFVGLLFPFVQGLFATCLYFRREHLLPPNSGVYLGIDHRNGWMAMGGTLASLIAMCRLALGHDWIVIESIPWQTAKVDADSLDTSNAFVYEGLLAFKIQTFLLSAKRRFPPTYQYRPVDYDHSAAFFVSLIIPGLTLIAIPLLFSSNIYSVKEYFRSRRIMNWFMIQRIGRIVRCLLIFAICFGAGMQLCADVVELLSVSRGQVESWNMNWAVEDTWRVPTLK